MVYNLKKDSEVMRLNAVIEELQEKASRSELTEQNLRDTRNKLDVQLERMTRIHKYALDAFQSDSPDVLCSTIAEGVVDIFQLELGAVFSLNLLDNIMSIRGSCNMPDADKITLSADWLKETGIWKQKQSGANCESPVISPIWADLNLAHVIYMPLFDNERHLEGMIMGAVTEESKRFYEFTPREIISPFIVFCQQMNGIINNIAAIEAAKQNARAKSIFLANISHEIRTPINAIIGMAQMATSSDEVAELKQFIKQIDDSSTHLIGLLTDVLDLSKIEEGKLSLNIAPFDLHHTVDSLVNSVSANAKSKDQNFTHQFRNLKHYNLKGDAMRLSQVILNLLSNAIKFTPKGGTVTLDVEEISADKDKVLIKFSINDTGIGVPQDSMTSIFSPFEQADSGISRKFGGTGLGLSISQRIVELMGSKIQVNSTINKGSSFFFYIWFEHGGDSLIQKTNSAPSKILDLTGQTFLIVDDIDINRKITAAFLRDLNVTIEQAENGQEAFDMFVNSAPGHYKLILMDMQMPIMDGCSCTKLIRASDRSDGKRVIIIALTANAFKEDIEEAFSAGVDAYISKPVKKEMLLETIQNTLLK